MAGNATETPITNLIPQADPSILNGKAIIVYDKTTGQAVAYEAEQLGVAVKDLSMFSIDGNPLNGRSTANCYVVRTTGVYKFPIVYGNALKNGVANTAAYTRQGTDYTADFVNHLGVAITSPFIEKNANCAPASANLLWQTGASLIDNVTIINEQDCKYIQFRVKEVPATNGNAVIAVKDISGTIMWSWHIWLTSHDLGPDEFVNNSPSTYHLMRENLGAMWNAERTRQFNPHYQWGRKDPMCPPANYSSSSNMTLYDEAGNSIIGFSVLGTDADESAEKTVANSIKKPNFFFTRHNSTNHNWNTLAWFNNFWNAAMTASSSLADDQATAVKTIYDPCPVGYMLPSGRAFTGFTTTGNNTTDATQFNVIDSWKNGWQFKRKSDDTEGNYFPASGYRSNDTGGLSNVSGYGYYWCFAPGSQAFARYLSFNSGGVAPLGSSYRSRGFSVRPVRELD